MPNYFGIGHSSLDNYIAMVSGQAPAPQTQDDCRDREYHDMAPTRMSADGQVVDERPAAITAASTRPRSRRSPTSSRPRPDVARLQRGHPRAVLGGATAARPTRTTSASTTRSSSSARSSTVGTCAANDVGLEPLDDDLQSRETTPNFSFIVPDQCNDGHDMCDDDDPSSLRRADAFLQTWIPKIMASPAYQDGPDHRDLRRGLRPTYCCNEQPGPNTASPGGSAWPQRRRPDAATDALAVHQARHGEPGPTTTTRCCAASRTCSGSPAPRLRRPGRPGQLRLGHLHRGDVAQRSQTSSGMTPARMSSANALQPRHRPAKASSEAATSSPPSTT